MSTTAQMSVEERVKLITAAFSQPWRWFVEKNWIVLEPPHGIITAKTMQHVAQSADVHMVEAVFRSTPSPGIYLRFQLRELPRETTAP